MKFLKKIVNMVAEIVVRRSANIEVGQGSDIQWLGLRSIKGGHLRIGENCIIRGRVIFDHPSGHIKFGNNCYLGSSLLVCHSGIDIGNDVIISWGVTIVDHNSHALEWEKRSGDVQDWMMGKKNWDVVDIAPVTISDKVWIGFGASILKGITIGEGAVIAAGAMVTKNVPPFTVVAGNPAKVINNLK